MVSTACNSLKKTLSILNGYILHPIIQKFCELIKMQFDNQITVNEKDNETTM